MNNYQATTQEIKAIQFNKTELKKLFSFIGNHLTSLPEKDIRKNIYEVCNLLARSTFGSYIIFSNGKFVNVTKEKFEQDYKLVK